MTLKARPSRPQARLLKALLEPGARIVKYGEGMSTFHKLQVSDEASPVDGVDVHAATWLALLLRDWIEETEESKRGHTPRPEYVLTARGREVIEEAKR